MGEGDPTNNKILCKLGEKWSQSSTRFKVLPEQRGFQLSIISGIQIGKRVLTGPPGIPIAAFFSHSSKRQNQFLYLNVNVNVKSLSPRDSKSIKIAIAHLFLKKK